MKRILENLVVACLVPPLRLCAQLAHVLHLPSLARAARYAWWKSRLAELGKATMIYPSVVIHGPEQVRVGAHVAIAEFVHMWGAGGITIKNDVLISSHCVITSVTHDPDVLPYRKANVAAPVIIEDNVWIGSHAVILPSVRIGTGSIVAAGSVVICDVPPGKTLPGVPAKEVGRQR